MVQGVKIQTSTAGCEGSIPGWGNKMLQGSGHSPQKGSGRKRTYEAHTHTYTQSILGEGGRDGSPVARTQVGHLNFFVSFDPLYHLVG